jgi:lipoate-protein ligase A
LPPIVAALLGLLSGVDAIMKGINDIKQETIKTGQYTPEDWAAFDAQHAAMLQQPQWQQETEA